MNVTATYHVVSAGRQDRLPPSPGALAVSALATAVADIGVTYRVSLIDSLNFEQVFHRQPTAVTVDRAHGAGRAREASLSAGPVEQSTP